jgi:hypothetical protein
MNPRTPQQVWDEIAKEHTPQNIDLIPGTLARIQKESKHTMKTKSFIAVPVALILILAVTAFVPGVAQAMQRLLGYIPGAGLVTQDQPLRVLSNPAQLKRGSTTISVIQAVLDSEHSTLVYQVENLPELKSAEPDWPLKSCSRLPVLTLPDGAQLPAESLSGSSWATGYSRRVSFPAVPVKTNSATLEFPCLEQTLMEEGVETWQVPLSFITAPPETTVYPVVDLPTPTPAPTQPAPTQTAAAQEPSTGAPSPQGVTLALSQYIPSNEGLILFGSLQSTSAAYNLVYVDPLAVHLRDASGQEILLEEDLSMADQVATAPEAQSIPLVFRTLASYTPGAATLSVDSAWINLNTDIKFQFDPGENPQPGQTWTLNQDITVAGRNIRITTAQMTADGKGLNFEFEAPSDINGLVLMDVDHKQLGGGGGENSTGFTYQDGFPGGPLTLSVSAVSMSLSGPWQASIDLPALANAESSTPTADACLTHSTWKQAVLKGTPALPAGLTGRLAMARLSEADFYYRAVTVNLDGSALQERGQGNSPALSPDGSRLIYNGDDGLRLVDLTTGNTTTLPGTTRSDRDALWSPDGSRFAFTRGPSSGPIGAPGPHSIFVASADGSNLHAVLQNGEGNFAQAWLPDGQQILFTVEGPNGASARSVNVASGEAKTLFEINYSNAGVAVSPDGKRVAFEAMEPGEQYGVYVSNLDGSNRKLVSNTSPFVTTHPQWSPDGRWLALSVHDTDLNENLPTIALVEVDTCQVLALANLNGYVTTWNP